MLTRLGPTGGGHIGGVQQVGAGLSLIGSGPGPAVTIQNTAAPNDAALLVKNAAGETVIQNAALGGGGPYDPVVGTWFNSGGGVVNIGNVRNWSTNSDLFVVHNRLTGSPTGSFVPMFAGYNAVSQPADGFNGSVNIPDEVVISCVAKAYNVAAGGSQIYDGGLRSAELQTLAYAGCGKTRSYGGVEVGIHTAVSQTNIFDTPTPDNAIGSYGVFIHSAAQTDPGYGAGVRACFGVLTGGGMGFKYPYGALDVDGVTRLWSVDQAGTQRSGHILPRSGSAYTLGSSAAGDFWSAVYSNFLVSTANGSASGPSVTWQGDTGTGLFRQAASTIGIALGGAEMIRLPATGELDFRSGQNVAVGTGTAAILGAVGGTGRPASTAMAGWLRMKVNGANVWTPYWA